MIELKNDELIFTFPEIHQSARLGISFQITLRIPDDGRDYPLPPGLGNFPLKHVDDYRNNLPEKWIEHGGVMLPMYQSEALWISFDSSLLYDHAARYPFAVKIATGKISAVTGESWSNGLSRNPQDYLVIPDQPWLDGYCVEKGFIRQFIAMPLGGGYTAEAQISGNEEVGGLQIEVYPMQREAFEKHWPKQPARHGYMLSAVNESSHVQYCLSAPDMGLAPGGRMRQEIYEDEFKLAEWDLNTSSRCFVHLANSEDWKAITGKNPPTTPPTARQYSEYGLPWFEYYSEKAALQGSGTLSGMKSVADMKESRGADALPENESADISTIINISRKKTPDQVREWKGRG